jgi:K+-sensing histidine kinase KdpD
MPDPNPPVPSALWEAPPAVGYVTSIVMTGAATAVAVGVDRAVTIPNLSLVFVVPVIIAGVGFGLGASLCSAVLGALAFNFFLTEPRYTLVVNDPANIWAIGLLFLVGLIVSGIAFTSRRRASDAELSRRQAALMQGYSRGIMGADSVQAIVSITSRTLAALFQVPVIVMLVAEGKVISVNRVGDVAPKAADFEAARTSLATGNLARAGVYPALMSHFDFWPVSAAGEGSAVIGLALEADNRPPAPDTLVEVVATVFALALDRQLGRNGFNSPLSQYVRDA